MVDLNDNKKPYYITCHLCHREHIVLANPIDVDDWLGQTKYIQDALAYLTAGERELFISGTCDDCWKKLYPHDDDMD